MGHEDEFIASVIWALDREFQYWESNMVDIKVSNTTHSLATYRSEVKGPRPEFYMEDLEKGDKLTEEEREKWYGHIQAATQSGWGPSSSRWILSSKMNPRLLDVTVGDYVPVDLNSFLCKSADILSKLFQKVGRKDLGDKYKKKKDKLVAAISAVLYADDGLWYDYNTVTNTRIQRFYPSNLSPLYSDCTPQEFDMSRTIQSILNLNETLLQPGGVPTSNYDGKGLDWDYPYVLPPLVEITVTALRKTNNPEVHSLARNIAHNFVKNVYRTWTNTGNILKKYNCTQSGVEEGDMEQNIQKTFGWTNGVTLTLLKMYPDLSSSSCFPYFTPVLLLFSILLHFFDKF